MTPVINTNTLGLSFRTCVLAIAGFLLLSVSAVVAQPTVDGFTTQQIHGFNVLVDDADKAAQPYGMQVAVEEMTAQLAAVEALALPANVLEAIREIKIFLVWNVRPDGAAWYHPNRQWLIDNGRNPEKALSVEIANATHFVNWSRQNQPWMVFHELTHAYHHQVLGFGHGPIIAAFENARDTGIYESVLYNPGGGQRRFSQRAYALVNEIEYFAEISEAYFGENDYFPFAQSDLATHDPQGFAAVEAAWEMNAPTAVEDHPTPSGFSLYPNPVYDVLRVDTPEPGTVRVFDMMGREVMARKVGSGAASLDVSTLAPGFYLVRMELGTRVESRPLVRVR